jgi:ribosomal protein S18 acetylase RimI-like enzyme/RimJ/RimL family protein N-acetyltransferase
MAQISFRRLEQDDLPRMFTWLSRPHVRKWYAPQPTSFAELLARYGPRTEEGSVVQSFIIEVDGADAGYIQAYSIDEFPEYERSLQCEKGVVGLDLFLGDDWRTRHGLGPKVIARFVDELLFGRYGATACVAGPHEGDEAAIRAFEKAGFRRWKSVTNERGERECVMRLDRDAQDFRIETIDLIDADACVAFRRQMYAASFGSEEGLEDELGPEAETYLADLRAKLAQIPEGNVHLWHGEQIVGQLEMRLIEQEPHLGYVSLICVLPGFRGKGLGRLLHEHAAEVCRRRDKRLMRLSVTLTNVPAIMFYRKLGWAMAGTRPNREPMAVMEFPLS